MKRIPELDGIRGLAISMVLVWHYFILPLQAHPGTALYYIRAAGRLTWTGVDLFFVLSGFLIGGILLDARDSPDYFRTFYLRRFFRIVPLYLIWFVLTLLVLWTLRAEPGKAVSRWALADHFTMAPYLLYLQNFWMTAHNTLTSYSAGGTWSLAIEEQFYLVLPCVIRFASRRALPWILGAAVVGATITRLAIYFLAPHHRMGIFVLLPCRMDALLLGVLGAMLLRSERGHAWLRENFRAMWGSLAILTLGAGVMTRKGIGPLDLVMSAGGYTWLAALYLCLILFVVTQTSRWPAAVMRWRWLRWMGTIAYAVYLFHIQVLIAVYVYFWTSPPLRLGSAGQLAAMLASLAVTIGICTLSWLHFEKPLVALGHRWRY